MTGRILVLEQPQATLDDVKQILIDAGYQVEGATSLFEATARMSGREFDLLVTPPAVAGATPQELFKQARQVSPDIQLIVVAEATELLGAIEAFERSAYSFVSRPIDATQFRLTITRALEYVNLLRENKAFRNGGLGTALEGKPLAEVEKQVILSTLARFKGHRLRTATALGIGLRTLGMKIKRWKEEGQLIESRG